MKRIYLAIGTLLFSLGNALADQPARTTASVVSMTATVEKVDTNKRELTLRGPDGNHFMVQVPESVQRLDELKAGDRLSVDHYQSIALSLKKGTEPAAETKAFAERSPGPMPGGMMGQQITANVKVTKVDQNKGLLMIQGPAGETDTVNVKEPALRAELKKIKAGDDIQVTYSEATAITVGKK